MRGTNEVEGKDTLEKEYLGNEGEEGKDEILVMKT
jgi:hypothetical protein